MPVATKQQPKIYIAGPFFNPPQLDLIKWIEDHLAQAEINFYSPRLHPGNDGGPIDNATANKIFRSNVVAIQECTHVLAVLDWLMPTGHELMVVKPAPQKFTDERWLYEGASRPLSLPDTGTVFEMGYATGINKPVLGYTDRKEGEGKLNIMLTQACRGMVYGPEHFRHVFWGGEIQWDRVRAWAGKNQ